MLVKKINIENLKFIDIFKYVWIYMRWCNYFFIGFFIVSLLLLFLEVNVIQYSLIYLLGGVLSISVHEYMHIVAIKKLTENTCIKIKITLNNFSIIPCEKIEGVNSIFVACSGPLACVMISAFLYILKLLFHLESFFVDLIIYSYGSHIISMLPFFNDGKMIIKEIIYMFWRGGDDQ